MVREIPSNIKFENSSGELVEVKPSIEANPVGDLGRLIGIGTGEFLEKGAFGSAELAEETVKGAGGWIEGLAGPKTYAQVIGALEAAGMNLSKEELDQFATAMQGGLMGSAAGPVGAVAGFIGGLGLGSVREELTTAQEGLETNLKAGLSNKTAGNVAEFIGQAGGYITNPGGASLRMAENAPKLFGAGMGLLTSGQMVNPEQTGLEKAGVAALGAAGGAAVGAAIPATINALGKVPKAYENMIGKAQDIVSKMTQGKQAILEKSAVTKAKMQQAEQAGQVRMQAQAQAAENQFRMVQEAEMRKQQEVQGLIKSQQSQELRPTFQALDDLPELQSKMMAQKTADDVIAGLLEAPNAETIFKDKTMGEVQSFVDNMVSEDFGRMAKQNKQKTQFRTIMRQNMEKARRETALGEMEQRLISLEQQKQDVLKAVHPELYVPETEYQKGLKENITQIQDELDRVTEASLVGDDLPDIPAVRELKEQQRIALKEAKQASLNQVSDEIRDVELEIAKIKEDNFDTFNQEFKPGSEKVSYEDARRGESSVVGKYQQKMKELQELTAQQRKLESELFSGKEPTADDMIVEGSDVQRILREKMTAEELKLSNTRKGQLTKARKKYGKVEEGQEVLEKLQDVEDINNELKALRERYLGTLQETAKFAKAATEKQIDAMKKYETAPTEQLLKGTEASKRLPKQQLNETGTPEIEIKIIDEPISAEGEPFGVDDLEIIEVQGKDGNAKIEVTKTPEGEVVGAKVKNPSKLNKEISQAERNPQTKTEKNIEGKLEQNGDEIKYKSPSHKPIQRFFNDLTKPIIALLEESGTLDLTRKVNKWANSHLMIDNRLNIEILSEVNKLTNSNFKNFNQLKKYLNKQFESKSDLVFANASYEDMGLNPKAIGIIEALNTKLSSLAETDINGTNIKNIGGWQDIENYIARDVADYEGLLEAMKLGNKDYQEMLRAVNEAFAEGVDPTMVIKNFQQRKNLDVTTQMQKFYSSVGDAYERKLRRMYKQMSDLEFFEGKLGKDAPAISDTIKSFIQREAPGLEDFKKQEVFDGVHALFTVDPIGVTALDSLGKALNHAVTSFTLSGLPTAGLQLASIPRFGAAFELRAFFSSFKHLFNSQFTGHDFSQVVGEFSDLSAKGIFKQFDDIAIMARAGQYGRLAQKGLETAASGFSNAATAPLKFASSRLELPIGMGSAFEDFVLKSQRFVKQQANGGEVNASLRNFIQRVKLLHGEKEALRLLRKFGDADYKFNKTKFDEDALHVTLSQVRDLGGFALSKADVAPALAESKTFASGATGGEVLTANVKRNLARFTSFTAKAGGVLRKKIVDEFKAGNPAGAFKNIGSFAIMSSIIPMYLRYVGKLTEVSLSADMAGISGEGKLELLNEADTIESQDRLLMDSFVGQYSPLLGIIGGRISESALGLMTKGDIQGFATAALDLLAVKGGGQALQTIGNTSAAMIKGLNPLDPTYNRSAKDIPFKWAGRINESIINPANKGVGAAKFEKIHRIAERVRSETPTAKALKEYKDTSRMISKFAEMGYGVEEIQERLKNKEKAKKDIQRISDKSYIDFVRRINKN